MDKPAVMKLQSGAVTSVRSAMFKDDPPVLRVVFDEIENAGKADPVTDGNTVSLQISDGISGETPAVSAEDSSRLLAQGCTIAGSRIAPEAARLWRNTRSSPSHNRWKQYRVPQPCGTASS